MVNLNECVVRFCQVLVARLIKASLRCSLGTVAEFGDALLPCAVSAAEDPTVRLDAVADHAAATVGAERRERLNRTLEAVERVPLASAHDFERLVVVVTANLADRHLSLLSRLPGSRTLPAGPPS